MVPAPAEGVAVGLGAEPLHLLLELSDALILLLELVSVRTDVRVSREEVGE